MLKVLERKQGVARVMKGTVNLALDDLRHFFSWAIRHDHYSGKNPCDGIAYEGIKQESYEVFTDEDLRVIFTGQDFLKERDGKHPDGLAPADPGVLRCTA